jgi:thiamine-phosphate pyrophosphorylase
MSLTNIAQLLKLQNGRQHLPHLIYLTDESHLIDPTAFISQLPRKAGIIFRHYKLRNRLRLAQKIKQICKDRDLTFIISKDVKLASILNADGLHLPEYLAVTPNFRFRAWKNKPNKILTAAAHSRQAIMRIKNLGFDASLVSPVFETKSHQSARYLGAVGFQTLISSSSTPAFALGGLNNKTAKLLKNTNAIGIAGIRGIVD